MKWQTFLWLSRRLMPPAASSIILYSLWAVFGGSGALAAEKIVFNASRGQLSLSAGELETFAQTGEVSAAVRDLLKATRQEPEIVRQALTKEVPVSLRIADRALNSQIGEAVLDKVGEVVHTPSGGADRQALRAAFVLSASGDNKISLLEVIKNYPTSEVEVEADRLADGFKQLSRFGETLQKWRDRLPKIVR
ncbi:alpha/beta hydrolase [Kamptonema formosum]|uniref:alpha/beta hydrolase n=1 Tax=Kamptonema formosum TaxID=331992 RepID=UPI000344DF2F|nr:alpha/beta hydrolase [Oscillatoria sp. PCC 10802]